MGFNTTVFILNDQIDAIERDPERFVRALSEEIVMQDGRRIPGQTTVMPTAHADEFRLYATQCNGITELSAYSKATMVMVNGEPWERDIIRRQVEQAEDQLKRLKKAIAKADTAPVAGVGEGNDHA